MRATTAVFVCLTAKAAFVAAQEPTLTPRLSFEVASVKVSTSNTRAPMLWTPGGHFTMGNLPAQSLVSIGYTVPLYRIVGLPDWVRTMRFDVNARAGRDVAIEERSAYYRGLLADRFGLEAHIEEREMPVYALVLARSDGRLGPGLRRSDANCDAAIAANRAQVEATGRPVPPEPGTRPRCSAIGGPTGFVGDAVELRGFVGMLGGSLERPIIDRTGLTGRFDIDFKSAPPRMADAARIGDLPSVFTAVQEQLGLKLESTTAPVPVLVIDRIRMPTED